MNARLIFNEDRHEYTVDGAVVPSVTQIIRFLSFDTATVASPAMRDAAAERGSRVHAACTAYDFDRDEAEIDGDVAGYVRAYASFLRDFSIKEWILFEKPLFARLAAGIFAGTIDRYACIDGVLTLVDIKTGSKLHMFIHRVQLVAYRLLLRTNGYEVGASAILHLRRDGTYSYRSVPSDDADALEAFGTCWHIHRYLKGEAK